MASMPKIDCELDIYNFYAVFWIGTIFLVFLTDVIIILERLFDEILKMFIRNLHGLNAEDDVYIYVYV
jgi:hypothetical protein